MFSFFFFYLLYCIPIYVRTCINIYLNNIYFNATITLTIEKSPSEIKKKKKKKKNI